VHIAGEGSITVAMYLARDPEDDTTLCLVWSDEANNRLYTWAPDLEAFVLNQELYDDFLYEHDLVYDLVSIPDALVAIAGEVGRIDLRRRRRFRSAPPPATSSLTVSQVLDLARAG
jgi:hypothetical protein